MVDIHHEGSCNAPLEVAFAYIDDYRLVPTWMFGISRVVPTGDLVHGVGAEFDATFAVKPITLHSTVRVTRWVENEMIEFESVKGFRNRSTWRFAASDPTTTVIEVLFSYELPGGLAGRALGKALEPIIALSIKHTDENLRRGIESTFAERG